MNVDADNSSCSQSMSIGNAQNKVSSENEEEVLLESKPVSPPGLLQDDSDAESYDPDQDSGVHEASADDDSQIKNNEMTAPLVTSSPNQSIVDSSPVQTCRENRLSSGSATSIINTSSNSFVQHSAVMSANIQKVHSTAMKQPHESSMEQTAILDNENQTEVSINPTQTTVQVQPVEVSVDTANPDNCNESSEGDSEVYSSVVSPQVAQRNLSPVNTLTLEQEMQKCDANANQVQSTTNDEIAQSVNTVAIQSQSLSGGDGGEVSQDIDDRNLEQYSEILLDSDVSLSDSETQSAVDKNGQPTEVKKLSKKVRFADEVQQKEHGSSSRPTQSPPLRPTLPTLSSPEDVAKQNTMPVSPSSPKNLVMSPQHTTSELIAGVEYPAEYLGSTPIFLAGVASAKSSRMYQAQQAVKLIKDPDNEGRPRFSVNVKISTQAIKIADSKADIDMMEHPLHTISYVADIDNVLVVMAHIVPAPDTVVQSPGPMDGTLTIENKEEVINDYTPKMTCHVLDTQNARHVAMVIGQAFSAAYKQFLRSSGITEESLEEAEYAHILNAQTVPKVEIDSFNDRSKTKKLTLPKRKGEWMGMMVMESGYGSAIPTCVVAHFSKDGAAKKSGLLNVGDHIISINSVNVVGMPKKACIEQIKKCRYQSVVKMVVCSCPAVVEVTIVRPDLKYQLGFSVQKGMITSLLRGSIGERSGIRVGHHIIEINGTSTVSMHHADIVHLLSSTVGDLHLRTMPDLMYKLLTGKIIADYY